MSDDIPRSTKDLRSHEIQSSIAQGKLMLNVLRSLPASENIQAFIVRFEELVSRLQKCELQCKQGIDAKGDVGTQFDILRKRQEKIKCLLEQTTQELQSTLAESLDIPETSHSINGNVAPTSEVVSELQMRLSNEPEASRSSVTQPTPDETAVIVSPGAQVDNNLSTSQSDYSKDLPSTDSNVVASTPCDQSSAKWSARFAIPVAKLDELIEDSRKFQNMVEQLIGITRKAHLTEATGFLEDISARFVDLRNSFDSLKKSYEEVRDSAELPSTLRELQLAGFQEFLERLDYNLESTKECFFNIYHLVKSEIETSIADGSLHTIESDPEEAGGNTAGAQQEQGSSQEEGLGSTEVEPPVGEEPRRGGEQAVAGIDDPGASRVAVSETAAVAVPAKPTVASDNNAEDVLASQKAYLVALQDQTASERREIQRLLRQRDQLAERLARLKATSLLADSLSQTEATADSSNNHSPSTVAVVDPRHKSARPPPTSTVTDASAEEASGQSPEAGDPLSALVMARQHQSTLLTHLEAKRRELERLHAQLNSLREAEVNTSSCGGTVNGQREAAGSRTTGKLSTGSISRVTRFRSEVHERDVSPPAGTPTASTNTEQLYENMREARILLEQQRDLSTSTDAKTLLQRLTGVASVANSQDRTTLATWGGSSSPVHSSTSTISGGEEEVDEDDEDAEGPAPASGVSVGTSVIPQSPEGIQLSVVSASPSSLLGFSPSDAAVDAGGSSMEKSAGRRTCTRQRRSHGTSTATVAVNGLLQTNTAQLGDLVALPQLGHSPSPPTQPLAPRNQSPRTGDHSIGTRGVMVESQEGAANCRPSSLSFPPCLPISDLPYALINERMQRMEMNIAQLFQACRCLAVENSSLRSTLSQLLMQPISAGGAGQPVNELLLVNPSASNSGMATPCASLADPMLLPQVVSPPQSQPLHLPTYQLLRQCPSVLPLRSSAAGGLSTPGLSEPVSGQQLALLQQQQMLEAQHLQQLLARPQLQQAQQQQPPVSCLLARRPFVQVSSSQLNGCDLQWLTTGSLCPPPANTLTVSGERLGPRLASNGLGVVTSSAGNHVLGPVSTGLAGALELGYTAINSNTANNNNNACLLSPQSSALPGHPVTASLAAVLPIVDPVYPVPISSSALLSQHYPGTVG